MTLKKAAFLTPVASIAKCCIRCRVFLKKLFHRKIAKNMGNISIVLF